MLGCQREINADFRQDDRRRAPTKIPKLFLTCLAVAHLPPTTPSSGSDPACFCEINAHEITKDSCDQLATLTSEGLATGIDMQREIHCGWTESVICGEEPYISSVDQAHSLIVVLRRPGVRYMTSNATLSLSSSSWRNRASGSLSHTSATCQMLSIWVDTVCISKF
jgi:hypothetical protein